MSVVRSPGSCNRFGVESGHSCGLTVSVSDDLRDPHVRRPHDWKARARPLRTTVINDLIRVLQSHRIPVPKRLALGHQPPACPPATSGIRIFPSPNADFVHAVSIYSMLGSR